MKLIKKDKDKAIKEKAEKELKSKRDLVRSEYLKLLSEDENFKRYVIEDIIDFEIREAEKSTFRNMELLVKASPEEVKNIAISKSANVLLLNKLKRLMNGD